MANPAACSDLPGCPHSYNRNEPTLDTRRAGCDVSDTLCHISPEHDAFQTQLQFFVSGPVAKHCADDNSTMP